MRYTGQCSHGMPLGRRCAKCDESPMADFTTVKVNTRELQAGVEELDALKSENAALRTRAESAERERDEAYAKGLERAAQIITDMIQDEQTQWALDDALQAIEAEKQ